MATGFDELRQAVIERQQDRFAAATETVLDETREAAPVATGALRASIVLSAIQFDGQTFSRTISSDVEHAIYTDQGTRPHRIPNGGGGPVAFYWPNAPGDLRASKSGKYVFAWVDHPGTIGTHWFGADNGVMQQRLHGALMGFE